jgi:hypothetical protein
MNDYGDYQSTVTKEPVTDLFRDLRDESMNLIRQQIELAKEETMEKVTKLLRNSAYLSGGAAVAFLGAFYILLGLNNLLLNGFVGAGMGRDTAVWLAPLLVGVVVGVIGYIFVQKAINTFKHASLVPEKTINSIKEDQQWLSNRRP